MPHNTQRHTDRCWPAGWSRTRRCYSTDSHCCCPRSRRTPGRPGSSRYFRRCNHRRKGSCTSRRRRARTGRPSTRSTCGPPDCCCSAHIRARRRSRVNRCTFRQSTSEASSGRRARMVPPHSNRGLRSACTSCTPLRTHIRWMQTLRSICSKSRRTPKGLEYIRAGSTYRRLLACRPPRSKSRQRPKCRDANRVAAAQRAAAEETPSPPNRSCSRRACTFR
mmetsp:Transcript_3594/g.10560  ORF Transcript_3594/g.10560 Transcript_3594/m.10560 type:complete len:221 (+) Transcript_3594:959-1621(+)